MKALAIGLAAALLLVHFGYLGLADHRAQMWAFYSLQGLNAAGLHALVLGAVIAWARPSRWRTIAIGCSATAIAEQLMVAGCGIAQYLRPIAPQPWQGLCGAEIGVDLGAVMLAVTVAFLVAQIGREGGRHGLR